MNESVFLEHIRTNRGIIYKLVGLYAIDSEDKKDLYQEILYQAWKSWPSFKGDSKVSTWLYRLCLNTILTQKRRENKIEYRENLERIAPAIPGAAEKNEDAQRLYQAIRQLAETDRALISLHLDGYDNNEMSEIMGITPNNVGVKLYRIKNQLSKMLKA